MDDSSSIPSSSLCSTTTAAPAAAATRKRPLEDDHPDPVAITGNNTAIAMDDASSEPLSQEESQLPQPTSVPQSMEAKVEEEELPVTATAAVLQSPPTNNGEVARTSSPTGAAATVAPDCLPLRRLRLEAMFHPKFDNEKQETTTTSGASAYNNNNTNKNDRSIRERMMERCTPTPRVGRFGWGYLEVTLKHSGSLLLWSGGSRLYSKNSCTNRFTAAGTILLHQHFARHTTAAACRRTEQTSNTNDSMEEDDEHDDSLISFQTCSDYLQRHRLTLSFEVVTAVLSDHGQRPHRDYLMLHAVADRRVASLDTTYDDKDDGNRTATLTTPKVPSSSSSSPSYFWQTRDVIRLAQRWRLPHNDVYMVVGGSDSDNNPTGEDALVANDATLSTNKNKLQSLFAHYDAARETGTCETVLPWLHTVSDVHVPSPCPHPVWQGDLLEGLVIRYVPWGIHTNDGTVEDTVVRATMQEMRSLAERGAVLQAELEQAYQCAAPEPTRNGNSAKMEPGMDNNVLTRDERIISCNLRELHARTKAAFSEEGSQLFQEQLLAVVRDEDCSVVECSNSSEEVPLWMAELWKQHTSDTVATCTLDTETQKVARLVLSLNEVSSSRVRYNVLQEKVRNTTRHLCIVNVIYDQVFGKFARERTGWKEGDLPLFRGFCFELLGGEDAVEEIDDASSFQLFHEDCPASMGSTNEESLMVKMKFLPYMVRTFGCRNGLKLLQQGGPDAFIRYTHNLLTKWGMSEMAIQKWGPFFRVWAHYANQCICGGDSGNPKLEEEKMILPPLTDAYYLDHLDLFQRFLDAGDLSSLDLESTCSFQGVAVVVCLKKETASLVGDYIAKELGGAKRIDGIQYLNKAIVSGACEKGRGLVCTTLAQEGGATSRRKLLEDYDDFVSIILFQCSENDISAMELSSKDEKKTRSMVHKWKATAPLFARVVELPDTSLFDSTVLDAHDELPKLCLSEKFIDTLSNLKVSVVKDERPGLLVFFPAVPGFGKSACVSNLEERLVERIKYGNESLSRKIIVQVGDTTQGKYWKVVKHVRTKKPASVCITDKNSPVQIWKTIGDICAATKALAVPVIPDFTALQTTLIKGMRVPGGEYIAEANHMYPFSLKYLAVCLSRVLGRKPGSHPGDLDASTRLACLAVIDMFSLYRNVSAEEFMINLSNAITTSGGILSPIPLEIPFFVHNREDPLPLDLEEVLVEALQTQWGYFCRDKRKKMSKPKKDEDDTSLQDLDMRIRKSIESNRIALESMTVPECETRESFLRGLEAKLAELDSISTYEVPRIVKLAAIDIPSQSICTLLDGVMESNDHVAATLTGLLHESCHNLTDQYQRDAAMDCGFVHTTHVTLAHMHNTLQSTFRATFGPLVGAHVSLTAHSLFWNDTVMALAVHVADETDDEGPENTNHRCKIPASDNHFVHVTVWFRDGEVAYAANKLPCQVEAGTAERVDFESPFSLHGIISLWDYESAIG